MQQSLRGHKPEDVSLINPKRETEIKPRTKKYKIILEIIKLLAGCSLLILSVQGISISHLLAGIRSADLTWLMLAILLVLIGLGLKLWRWLILIKNYGIHASFGRLFSAYFVGQAANIVLPLRGGELVRLGYFAGQKDIIPEVASTIILEKYLDLLALAGCAILISLKISLDNILNLYRFLLPITFIITVVFILVIILGPSLWEKIRGHHRLPHRLVTWIDRWVQASNWLKNPIQLFSGIILTMLIWSVMCLTNLVLFKSFGLPLGATAGGLVLVLVYIGLFPALMPGNIGPFYFFANIALLPFGILHDQAFPFVVILHAIVTLPPLLGGLIGLLIHSERPFYA